MTIRKDAWDSGELQILYDLVNEEVWLDRAVAILRNRTKTAIQTKMSNLRAEAGIVPGVYGPRAMANCRIHRKAISDSSARLRDAVLMAAA